MSGSFAKPAGEHLNQRQRRAGVRLESRIQVVAVDGKAASTAPSATTSAILPPPVSTSISPTISPAPSYEAPAGPGDTYRPFGHEQQLVAVTRRFA